MYCRRRRAGASGLARRAAAGARTRTARRRGAHRPGRRPDVEDHAYRTCGREGLPITFLDLGPADTDAPHAWGANMTIRRSALDRIGPFDEALGLYGDEQEWQSGCSLRAGACATSRTPRSSTAGQGDDARLRSLARAAWFRGRASRRFDGVKGASPSLAAELRVLAGCIAHGPLRRCMNGPVLAAHSAGRLREALGVGGARRPATPGVDDFLAGRSGPWAGAATSCAGWPTSHSTPRRCRAGCARPRAGAPADPRRRHPSGPGVGSWTRRSPSCCAPATR